MKPLGASIIRHNVASIDNMSWGKARLRGEHAEFYAIDYDLYVGRENKKSARQAAKIEIRNGEIDYKYRDQF